LATKWERASGNPLGTSETDIATVRVDSGASEVVKYRANGVVKELVEKGATQTLTAKTLTSPVLNGPLTTEAAEVVTTANVITAAETGTTFFLNAAGGFASTLPAAALGLKFRFVVKTAPTTAYTVVTPGAPDQIIFGGQHDAGGAAGDVESTGGATTLTFVANQAVVGDWAEFICDGTNWYVRAFSNVAAGITFTG
jgi:hypothetical protein